MGSDDGLLREDLRQYDVVTAERERMLHRVILAFTIILWPVLIAALCRAAITGFSPIIFAVLIFTIGTSLCFWYRHQLSMTIQAWFLLGMLMATSGIGYLSFSFSASPEMTSLLTSMVAYILFGPRIGMAVAICLSLFAIIAHCMFSLLDFRPAYDANVLLRDFWVGLAPVLAMCLILIAVMRMTVGSFSERVNDAFSRLHASQKRYQRAVRATEDGIWEWDITADHFTYAEQACQFFGSTTPCTDTRASLLHKVLPEDREHLAAALSRLCKSPDPSDALFRLQVGEQQRWFQLRGQSNFNDTRPLPATQATGSIRDIHDLHTTEENLRQREQSYRAFVNNSSEGIWCLYYDPPIQLQSPNLFEQLIAGTFVESNQALVDIFEVASLDDLLGKRPVDILTAEHEVANLRALFERFIANDCRNTTVETQRPHAGPGLKHLRHAIQGQVDNDQLVRVWGVTSDFTDLRDTQQHLQHAQKMDAIGQLAGGIAHDFNNNLGGILGAAEMLNLMVKADDDQSKRFVEIILKATERARDLNSKLLTFSRKSKAISSKLCLEDLLRETVALLQRSIDPRVQIITDISCERSTIIGDPAEIQSALMNLGVNARDAMQDKGTLTFRLSAVQLNQEDCSAYINADLEAGHYMRIEVQDTGCGIPPEIRERMFEPFFTTKEAGKGTGLGLAAVFGTMRQHGGAIKVTSIIDAGTCFELVFPAHDGSVATSSIPRLTTAQETSARRVLLVDDDELIRETTGLMLKQLGYSIHTVKNGQEALDYIVTHHHHIDVILLDFTMPDMTGEEVFERIHRAYPDIPVVLGSGFVSERISKRLQEAGLHWQVSKPYSMDEIATALRQALDDTNNKPKPD